MTRAAPTYRKRRAAIPAIPAAPDVEPTETREERAAKWQREAEARRAIMARAATFNDAIQELVDAGAMTEATAKAIRRPE